MLTITAGNNPKIKNLKKLIKSASHRRLSGLFVAEGLRLCYDAMLSGAQIEELYLTEQASEKSPEKCAELIAYSRRAYKVAPALFAQVSDTKTPQGILCVIKGLDKTVEFDTINNGGKFLALENVQDPNNLGTVLRSAEAFGVSGVILSSDCCDIYNPKVVRGSMGAVFRVPFLVCESISDFLRENPELNSYAAVVDSKAEKVTETEFEAPCVTVIGNEGNGLKPETTAQCSHRITIPMRGKAESLNASTAASILIWEMIK